MDIEKRNVAKYKDEVLDGFVVSNNRKRKPNLSRIILHHNECVCLYDLMQNKIVLQKGYHNLTGYHENETSLKFRKSTFHPDDLDLVNRIEKAILLYCMNNPKDCYKAILSISYRIRKKDGSFIRVLRKASVYDKNEKGEIKTVLIKLTDISFLDQSSLVKWNFESKNLDKAALREQIYKAYSDFFTLREKEIIREISNGLTTNSIANKLNISRHTVATHRKNIFKKANRNTSKDLILFCKRKGVL